VGSFRGMSGDIFPLPDPEPVLARALHDGPVFAVLVRDDAEGERIGELRRGIDLADGPGFNCHAAAAKMFGDPAGEVERVVFTAGDGVLAASAFDPGVVPGGPCGAELPCCVHGVNMTQNSKFKISN
jgi:hypothetical protein